MWSGKIWDRVNSLGTFSLRQLLTKVTHEIDMDGKIDAAKFMRILEEEWLGDLEPKEQPEMEKLKEEIWDRSGRVIRTQHVTGMSLRSDEERKENEEEQKGLDEFWLKTMTQILKISCSGDCFGSREKGLELAKSFGRWLTEAEAEGLIFEESR